MRRDDSAYLLPHLIDQAAMVDPDHTAMKCRDQSLTYGELQQRSSALASALMESGVRRGDRVGILMNKRVEAAVAIYGIMKAGAAYVPLDPLAPPSRLEFVIRDCGIRVLISEERKRPALEILGQRGLVLDSVVGLKEVAHYRSLSWADVDSCATESPRIEEPTELDLCYVLYTSGSTGVPKGIMHTHRSALSWANVTSSTYSISRNDVISNYAPLHFDLSTLDFFGGARAGSTTVMIPEEHMKLPASLAGLLESEALTLFYTVPMALVQLATPGLLEGRDLSSLTRVLFGGEPMPVKHLHSLMNRLPRARFFNVYGPTEVNGCTHHEVIPPLKVEDGPLPIGKPYDNVEALVVDGEGNSVGDGEIGELAIRTPTMMRGYWGRPDLNANAFLYRNRYEGLPEVFHRTGDLVQRDESGDLRFHGRKDRQIKARGYRVELDEIEALLVAHSSVREAAVFAVASDLADTAIHASVILDHQNATSEADLRSYLSESLPPYAVPGVLNISTDLPRTTTGKIDRRALASEVHRVSSS